MKDNINQSEQPTSKKENIYMKLTKEHMRYHIPIERYTKTQH